MKGTLIQVFVVFIISIGNFFTSFTISWPSYALEYLGSANSPLGRNITESEGNLIGSLPMLGSLLVTPFSGYLADNLGRKRSEVLIALCFVLGWTILITAKSVIQIYISRIALGLANGAHGVLCLPLVSELGTASTRGALMSFLIFNYTIGSLSSYLAGWLMSYEAVNYMGLCLSVAYTILLLVFMKESPVYLILKKDNKGALRSLNYYRGVSKATQEVLDEFDYLKSQNNSNDQTYEDNKIDSSEKEKLRQEELKDQEMSAWQILRTSKPTQRALFISLVNVLLIAFGGTIGVTAYAGPLFKIGAPGLSKDMCSIVLSLAFVFGSLFATVANTFMGRRSLQISSAVISSFILAVLASLLRWPWAPEWMVPATVLGFCFFYQIGVANVTFVQLGEIFLPKIKNMVSVIMMTTICLGNFIVLTLFTTAVKYLSLDGTFMFFSIVCVITAIFAYFTMKETKGLKVEEILKMYENGYLYRK